MSQAIDKIVNVPLTWDEVIKEFSWINSTQGEAYVPSYLIRYPQRIDSRLTPDDFRGTEVALPVNQNLAIHYTPGDPAVGVIEIDLVFLKDGQYFVVEAKQADLSDKTQLTNRNKAENQLQRNARIMKEHLDANAIQYDGITPVLAWIEGYPPDSAGKLSPEGYMRGTTEREVIRIPSVSIP